MIPYFQFTVIPIGPLHIQVWGLFVATGIVTAVLVGRRFAGKRGLDRDAFLDFASWTIVCALVGARLFHAFAYEPAAFIADPAKLIRIWEGGMSSFGGFIGAAVGAIAFSRIRRIAFRAYAEPACFAFPLGYGIGRIGCFLIHDHPGTLSHSLLAVRYPDGARLDHGLLLSLTGFAIFLGFLVAQRRFPKAIEGRFLPFLMVSYGAVRFMLDFFRAADVPSADVRYFGLTPGHYGSIALVIAGAYLLSRPRPAVRSA